MTDVSKIETVGKRRLCEVLGWSRPTLDHRLKVDPNFPVVSIGDQRGGWRFDVAAVRDYLGTGGTKASDKAAGRSAPPAVGATIYTLSAGEATARQRKDSARAALLEDKARLARSELVERAKMENDVGLMIARFAKGLDGLPDTISKRLGLPGESTVVVRELVDGMRRSMVDDLRDLLSNKGE